LNDRISDMKELKSTEKGRIAKAVRDAENLIACPASTAYLGSRKKLGCNGLTNTCELCTTKYEEKHPEGVAV
jgi:hypothetical protein